MFPYGGIASMLLLSAIALIPCGLLALALRSRTGWVVALATGGFWWSLAVIAAVTLLPMYVRHGYIPVEEAQTACSWDIGGPAPQGFWIFGGTQRTLNALIFAVPGTLLVLMVSRLRWWALLLVPVGLVGLVGYSFMIEVTQLQLTRLDRACDITDLLDNALGAGAGVLLGIVLALLLRPWRRVPRH